MHLENNLLPLIIKRNLRKTYQQEQVQLINLCQISKDFYLYLKAVA